MFKFLSSLIQHKKRPSDNQNGLLKKQPSIVFPVKTTQEKPNKYSPISIEPYLNLAQKSPLEAALKLRERYDEISDYVAPFAISHLAWDNFGKWHELVKILYLVDPIVSKTIYCQLLYLRNSPSYHDNGKASPLNFNMIAEELYSLEKQRPELNKKGKVQVLFALIQASPELTFWQECLEKVFDLASELTLPQEEGYIAMIAQTVFYAENIPELRERFSKELYSRLYDPEFLMGTKKPAWNRGYFFNNMHDFCLRKWGRNSSFPPNSRTTLNLILQEALWNWVQQYAKEESSEALEILQHAIHSSDEVLSLEASDAYIKNFPIIAKKDPQKASKCLYEIASYSCCHFTDGKGTEERHQNFNLYKVFDETITILQNIDGNVAIYPFEALLRSHGGSARMQNKYRSEIMMADLHQRDRRNSK